MNLSINNSTKISMLVVCLSFLTCNHHKTEKTVVQVVPVTLQAVQEESVNYFGEYPGVVNPLNEVEIISQVTGSITEIYFVDGQKVKKNQKLYSIDNRQFKAIYNQAVANLDAAKANLGKAQKDADRYSFLLEKDAIARQTVDYALAALETAKMQVKVAEEDVINQSTYLHYSEINSPVDGTIGFSNVKKGALVTAGNTILNTVSSDDPIAVDFYINEKEVPGFMQNMKETNKDSLFSILLPGGSVYPSPGKVYAVDRSINVQTATLRVRLSFSNPDELLKEGQSCTVRMKVHNATIQKLVPYKALVEQMGEYFVFILSPDSTVKEQKVVKGRTIGRNVVIENGLSGEEHVVVEGVQKLRTGTKVTDTKK